MKYGMSKEFSICSLMRPPAGRALLSLGNAFLGIAFRLFTGGKALNVKRKKVPMRDGSKRLAAVITPKSSSERLPCLLYLHGGGFMFRAAFHHFSLAKTYAESARCVTVMPDYRLSPKHPYPVPLFDCADTLFWLIENAKSLNIDVLRIAVAGDSAGGALAASLTQLLRDTNGFKFILQMLLYPVTDRGMSSASMKKFTDTPMWNSRLNAIMWKRYAGEGDCAYASPVSATSLEGLPEAYIETAEIDCLHDEGVLYAKRLADSGVKTALVETKGTPHGFDFILRCRTTRECIEKRCEALKKAFSANNT